MTFSAYLTGGVPDDVPLWREAPMVAQDRTVEGAIPNPSRAQAAPSRDAQE